MDFIDEVRTRAARFAQKLEHLETEEATKTALVLPFIQMLGYNPFDPQEVLPEFDAGFGSKKDAKVDYALLQHGQPIILIEAKKYGFPLTVESLGQLASYFAATNARFGVLTDGIIYRFFSDLDKPNTMDMEPFFDFNMLDYSDSAITALKRFTKEEFDVNGTLEAAAVLKYIEGMKQALACQLTAPDPDFSKWLVRKVYTKGIGKTVMERFLPLVRQAFRAFVDERINDTLKSALARDAGAGEQPPEAQPPVTFPVNVFMRKTVDQLDARGRQEEQGFVLLAGSQMKKRPSTSLRGSDAAIRDSMLSNGILVDDNSGFYCLTRDYGFHSSSAAARLVLGNKGTSGLTTWRDAEGRTLKQLLK